MSHELAPPTDLEVEVVQHEETAIRIRVRHVSFSFTRATPRAHFDVWDALVQTKDAGAWVHERWLKSARALAVDRLDSILRGHAPNRLQAPQRCGECQALVMLPARAERLEELVCGPEHVAVYSDGARAVMWPGQPAALFGPDGSPLPATE